MKRPEGFDARSRATPGRSANPTRPGAEPTRGARGGAQPAQKPPAKGAAQKPPKTARKEPQPPKAEHARAPRSAAPDPTAQRPAREQPRVALPTTGQDRTPSGRAAEKTKPAATRVAGSRRPVVPKTKATSPRVPETAAEPLPSRTQRTRPRFPARSLSPEAEARRAARQRRRFEKGEIRRFTRRARNRRLAWMAGLVLVIGMFGGVAAAVFSPLFALSQIELRGADRVDTAEVHAALEGQLGTPLALLDEGAIRRELGEFPLVRSFITELVPPDTLVIRITEREPVGAITSDSGFNLTDPAGVVVQSVQQRPEGMPLIDVGEKGVSSAAFRSATEVLLALPDNLAARVDTVTARTKDDVTLVLTGSDQRVLWGSAEHSDTKARALAGLVAQFADAGPGQYDVSAPLTVVFRAD